MRKWIIISLILFAPFIFLPQISSTRIGKPYVTKGLENKLHGHIEVNSLDLSWLGPQIFKGVHYSNQDVIGKIDELRIEAPFWSFSGPISLQNGTLTTQEGEIEQIEGKVTDRKFELTASGGKIKLEGEYISKTDFDIHGQLLNFPSSPLDQWLKAEGLVSSLLGHTVTVKGFTKVKETEGEVAVDLSSPNLQTNLKGNLTQDSLTLKEPLDVTIRLTPSLSRELLKIGNSPFFTSLESQKPIHLKIDPQDFSLPLTGNLNQLQIGKGELVLDQVQLEEGAGINIIMTMLKVNRFAHSNKMSGWFTPIIFRLHDGQLKIDRVDALIGGSIHLCSWGEINLRNEKLHLFIGISGKTLENSFGIKNLPSNYMLSIPVKGTLKKPKIEKEAAAAQISALIAKGELEKKNKGFENLIDIFSKKENHPDVPPITSPLPWEK